MASINLQDIILDNRDLEIGNTNTYTLNSDLIIGENSTVFFKAIDKFQVASSGSTGEGGNTVPFKIKLKSTTSKIQFDSLILKEFVNTFIATHIIDSTVTAEQMNNSLTAQELTDLQTSLESSDKSQQILSDEFPCILGTTKVKTTKGFIPANKLKNDSIIVTHDNRHVPIVNIYASDIVTNNKNSPYIIPAHYFTRNYPKKQFMISPLHAVATNKKAIEWFIPREHGDKLKRMEHGNKIQYYHIELPNWLTDHLVIEGETLVESYGVNFHKGLDSVFYIRSRESGYYKRDLETYKRFLSSKTKQERKNKNIIFE